MRDPLDVMAGRAFKNEESIVIDGAEVASPRLKRRLLARFTFALGAAALTMFEATETAGYLLLLCPAFMWAGAEFMRAGAYRNGWVQGRDHMMESARRYDRIETWVEAMFVHDTHVLGYRIVTPDSPEGLEDLP